VDIPKLLFPTAILATTAIAVAGVAAAASGAAGAAPALVTNRGCYLVGQPVDITGTGFAPQQMYQVAVDGIDFGVSTTDANGNFTASLRPGGLGANIVQTAYTLTASDGISTSKTVFTVTRTAGARILVTAGRTPTTLRGRFQIWGFALSHGQPPPTYAVQRPVYVHYVGPRHGLRTTVLLGATGGQCGYLRTSSRRVFPFAPAAGTWTLQLDTNSAYFKHPLGPVARITVNVR
jgi:hypothetical protein